MRIALSERRSSSLLWSKAIIRVARYLIGAILTTTNTRERISEMNKMYACNALQALHRERVPGLVDVFTHRQVLLGNRHEGNAQRHRHILPGYERVRCAP